jgi:GntR family transcriptional regulator
VRRGSLKYLQVRDYLRTLATQDLDAGDPLPSERELCDRFSVSRMTVRQAVDALVVEGLLERVHGRGMFVARPKVDLQVRLTSFSEEMRRRGMTPSVKHLRAEVVPADARIAAALEIEPADPVVHLHQLRYADGEPMSVQHSWLVEALVPGLIDTPPDSLYVELDRRGLLPAWGEDTVDAGEADTEEAQLLHIHKGRAVLRIARRAFSRDLAVEYSEAVYRADRYTLWVPVARPQPAIVPSQRQRTGGRTLGRPDLPEQEPPT